ncbi:precorrin-6A reductase [Clostridium sp. E02]|uniref:precorrin-6A reductase n=1 Tax=Clostridium sp. E02 TaxID=2487134 RepID=UPI000F520B67|nr:precorrin-6A reductase [Clostridium sp. E02]
MCKILIFGGTTEGRILSEYCQEKQIHVWVSVATGYGKLVLSSSPYLHIRETPMDATQMEQFIQEKRIRLVLDATHPYATEVSKNIESACEKTGVRSLRIVRESIELDTKDQKSPGKVIWVDSVEEAIGYLNERIGNVLVTTGSKELIRFTNMEDFLDRIYARVLPSVSVFSACEEMGIKGSHLIGMQGPFSTELNTAMIKQFDIQYLVTKEAGSRGGYSEKLEAAAQMGVTTVVIGRPLAESGISLKEAKKELLCFQSPETLSVTKRSVYLIGTGMGGEGAMTGVAMKAMMSCQVLFGAERMLSQPLVQEAVGIKIPFYRSQDILPWLIKHNEYDTVGVLFSGDTGFYSGASKMAEELKKDPYQREFQVNSLPGVSTVSYLCARLNTSWEKVRLVSLHGREWNLIEELRKHPRIFSLLDRTNSVNALCRLLKEKGYQDVRLSVGERLSYPEERIRIGTPEELETAEFDKLSAVLIER